MIILTKHEVSSSSCELPHFPLTFHTSASSSSVQNDRETSFCLTVFGIFLFMWLPYLHEMKLLFYESFSCQFHS